MNELEFKSDINKQEKIPIEFLIYWFGQVFSLFGSEITQFAIIWWIAISYNSFLFLGFALFASNLTRIFVLPLAGSISDSENRKNILIFSDFLQAIVTLVLIILFSYGLVNLYILLVLLTFRGFFQSIHSITNQAIIPQQVPKDMFSRLNAMNLFSYGLSNFGGPLIGAVLVQITGLQNISFVLWIDIFSFIIALLAIIKMKIPKVNINKLSFRSNIIFGVNYLKSNKHLRIITTISPVINFTLTFTHILIPILVISPFYFKGGTSELGLALGIQSLGLILASIIISYRSIKNNFARNYFFSTILWAFGILVVAISFYVKIFLLLLFGQFLTGIAISYYNVNSQTIWQRLIPNEMLGRVLAVVRMIASISYPLALLIAGYLGEIIDPVTLVISGVLINLFYLILVWYFSQFKNIDEFIENSQVNLSL